MIFFATVHLGEQVHAGPLRFTTTIYEFVWADNQEKVPSLVESWCQRKGIKFDRVRTISAAHQQDPLRYVWPEQIIGYDGRAAR